MTELDRCVHHSRTMLLLSVMTAVAVFLAGCPEPTQPSPPAAPSNLLANSSSSTTIEVKWDDNSDNEAGFVLHYSTDSGFGSRMEISIAANTSVKVVDGLSPSTQYYFRVQATNEVGSSDFSPVAASTTWPPPAGAPAAPSAVSAVAASTTSITVSWTDNSDNETGFTLHACKDPGFLSGVIADTLGADTVSHLVEGLDPGTRYYFRVNAVNGQGSSTWAGPADVSTIQAVAGTMTIFADMPVTRSRQGAMTCSMTGAVEMRFQNAGEHWSAWEPYAATTSWTLTGGDGTKTVSGQFMDAGGGVVNRSDTIVLHATPPEVTMFVIDDGAEYAASRVVDLTITAADTASMQMRFSNDNSTWTSWGTYNALRENYQMSDGDGLKTVYAQIRDQYDNTTSVSDTIILDTTPPVVTSFSINGGAAYTNTSNVTLNNSVTAAEEMRFQNYPGGAWSAWEPYAATKAWQLAGGTGDKTVVAQFRDDSVWVAQTPDTITVDTTDPIVGTFTINDGASYTTSTGVTLTIGANGATQMRFQNSGGSWSSWEAYAGSKAWTLTNGDASKMVNAEFRDDALNVVSKTDSIILDTTAPTVGSFAINGGDSSTNTNAATLSLSVTGAAQMRFRNTGGLWSAWQAYASSKTWTLITTENQNSTVSAEFRDAAGNVSSASDTIYFDAIRRVRITAERIHVGDDGDSSFGDPGEMCWGFGALDTDGAWFPVYNLSPDYYHSMESGDTWDFPDVSGIVSLANLSGKQFGIHFRLFDDDGSLMDPDVSAPSTNYYAYPDWGIGSTLSIVAVGTPSGTMYFRIELVD